MSGDLMVTQASAAGMARRIPIRAYRWYYLYATRFTGREPGSTRV